MNNCAAFMLVTIFGLGESGKITFQMIVKRVRLIRARDVYFDISTFSQLSSILSQDQGFTWKEILLADLFLLILRPFGKLLLHTG